MDVPASCSPVLSCLVLAVLSTLQTPAVLLRSRKRLVSSGAGYGPGPISVLPCYLIHCPQRVILTLWGNCPVFGFTIGRGTTSLRTTYRPQRFFIKKNLVTILEFSVILIKRGVENAKYKDGEVGVTV